MNLNSDSSLLINIFNYIIENELDRGICNRYDFGMYHFKVIASEEIRKEIDAEILKDIKLEVEKANVARAENDKNILKGANKN